MLNILWFRRDLRVSDHLPLLKAVDDGLVAPIVIVEPEYWAQPFASARQWRFAGRAITALRSQLAVIGAPLVVRTGDAIETIESLQERSRDVALWSHDTVGSAWEVERDRRVAEWTDRMGIPWNRLPDTGGRPDTPESGDPWPYILAERPSPPPELMIAHGVTPGRVVSERILYLDDDPCEDLPAGPAGARRVLETFMSAAEAETAGTADVEQAISDLAPHFAWGTLSVREVWYELERLKPDADAIACTLQNRLIQSFGAAKPARPAYEPSEISFEAIETALSDLPLLTLAYSKLRDRGLIREDLLAISATVAAARLSVTPQTILNVLANARTAFVEDLDVIARYPEATGFNGLTDPSAINAALAEVDSGCFADALPG